VSLGLADPISWLIARRCDDLAVPKLIEEGLMCIMELYQCCLWLRELTNIVCTEYGLRLVTSAVRWPPAVTWSRERSPYTSLTAALMTRCSGAIVEYGSPASRAFP